MHIRTIVGILACVLSAAVALAGCGSGSSSEAGTSSTSGKAAGTLTIMGETELLEPAMMKPFEAANPQINVESTVVEGSSQAAAKLSAGFGADLVETCADESNALTEKDLLQPIDTSKLAHWNELYPHLRAAPGEVVKGEQMFVPGQAGAFGLIYSPKSFPSGVDEIKELFNPKLKGRVALAVGGDDKAPIAMTAFSLGIKDPFAMSPSELSRVRKYLVAHGSQFRSFPGSDADQLNLMKSGEVVLMSGGRGTAIEMQEGGVSAKFTLPKEGYYSWTCGLGISKNAKNLPAAYAFLNYYTSAKAQAVFGNEGYTVINQNAAALVEPQFRETATPDSLSGTVVETAPRGASEEEWLEAFQEVVAG